MSLQKRITQGEWKAESGYRKGWRIVSGDQVVCTIRGSDYAERCCNAILIEKAPELYRELSRIVALCGDLPEFKSATELMEQLKR